MLFSFSFSFCWLSSFSLYSLPSQQQTWKRTYFYLFPDIAFLYFLCISILPVLSYHIPIQIRSYIAEEQLYSCRSCVNLLSLCELFFYFSSSSRREFCCCCWPAGQNEMTCRSAPMHRGRPLSTHDFSTCISLRTVKRETDSFLALM